MGDGGERVVELHERNNDHRTERWNPPSTFKTPWEKLMSAFNLPEILTIVATVGSLVVTGFFVGRRVNIHPIEAGIVAACRASQGGTGDVAILSASERMTMMPYAQVATRIGGAITVTLALALFAKFGV